MRLIGFGNRALQCSLLEDFVSNLARAGTNYQVVLPWEIKL
jgi:hypothetical protein